MSKRRIQWAVLSTGLNTAAVQGVLIRLLLVSFSGNELSIGLILGNWMLAEALGSRLGGHFSRRLRDPLLALAPLQLGFGLAAPLTVTLAYVARRLAGAAPGEALGLAAMFWTSLLILSPLSAVHGAMFSVACAAYNKTSGPPHTGLGPLYALEAVGALAGGVLLTYVLVRHLAPVQTALLLTLVSLATALFVLASVQALSWRRGALVMSAVVFAIILPLSVSSPSRALHRLLVQTRWGGVYHIVYDRDSPYGNIAVAQLGGQYTFLADGTPVATTPVPDIVTVEELAHLPMLFHPHPQRVLVIGGGWGGLLHEVLKYPSVERVDYAELDPWLIEAARAFSTPLTDEELRDPRVHVHAVDGRLLLHTLVGQEGPATPRYDAVLVNLPYPSTLELNRFYTEECFQLVRQALDEHGIAVFHMPGSLTYIGPGMRDLNLLLRSGLSTAFEHVWPVPGDMALWLASPSLSTLSLEQLADRWQERQLPTAFITTEHLRLRFDLQRLSWFEDSLRTDQPIQANRDLHPIGVLYGLSYWSEIFAPATQRFLLIVRRIRLGSYAAFVLGVTLLVGLVVRKRHGGWRHIAPVVVATTGFGGMVCGLMVLLVFQALCGYVYQYVALIIASFMAGLALGSWTMSRRDERPGKPQGGEATSRNQRALVRSEITMIAYWLALPALLHGLAAARGFPLMPFLLLLNAVGGWLVGLQFPLSSRLFPARAGDPGHAAGVLYAADLAGGFLGAVTGGIALLPVLGVVGTCLLVALVKVCSLALVLAEPAVSAAHTPGIV